MTGYAQNNFQQEQYSPTAITATMPVVVTIVGGNFSDGQAFRCTQFWINPPSQATGMEQLNNKLYYARNCTADTFELYDAAGYAIDGRGFTAFVNNGIAQMTLTGPRLFIQNTATEPA